MRQVFEKIKSSFQSFKEWLKPMFIIMPEIFLLPIIFVIAYLIAVSD